ncbi:MAG: histidine ammonia-lyase [Rhodobacteraceae bacterium]|nr:histidine ammonia-lyase [Paracoccaceae bacterium]
MYCESEVTTLHELLRLHRGGRLKLPANCRAAVEASAAAVAKCAAGSKPVYGVNTGFGKLASVRIEPERTSELQQRLILSHCCGVGSLLPDSVVRMIIALKILSLARGASGVRWSLIEMLLRFHELGVAPHIPSQGSLGASGDLAPLAHLTLAMLGKGRANHNGADFPAARVLRTIGCEPLELAPKEGLAMINGTQVSTALALVAFFDAWHLAMSSLTVGAMSTDAAMASPSPFRPELHELRGHTGQMEAAATLRQLLEGSDIRASHRLDDERVQDPYCIRCQPQVMGAAMTVLRQAGDVLRVEATAVTDNPLVLADGSIVSGGNFHAEPVAFAADQIALAIAEIGSISQRRIAMLVDPATSYGLPAFLVPEPGYNSGLMAAEIVSAALAAENKALANPRVVDSLTTSANQEDHVSMSCHAAQRLFEMNTNLCKIIAIEAMCAAQGLDFRKPLMTSLALQRFHRRLRKASKQVKTDRYLAPDINRVARLVGDGMFVPDRCPDMEN